MFCFKCGAEIPDESEFCFKCGTKIQIQQSENQNNRDADFLPQISCGTYKGNLCELTIDKGKLILSKKILIKTVTTEILFTDIVDVTFYPAAGLSVGSILIITTQNLNDFNIDKSQFAINPYVVNFTTKSKNEFNKVFSELSKIVQINRRQDLLDKINTDDKRLSSNSQETKNKPFSKRQRIKENKRNGVACCPKCGSTSLSSGKQGFGIGKAVVGAGLIGNPIGLAAGNINSKKVHVTCLNCGHKWKI